MPRSRTRASDAHRPFHGVVEFHPPEGGLLERCRSLATVMPPTQFFSHGTAVALWGGPLPGRVERLDVGVHAPRTAPRRRGVRGRSVVGVDVVERDGLRLVAPADAWVQLAPLLAREDLVAAAEGMLPSRHRDGVVELAAFGAALSRLAGHVGVGVARAALPLLRPGVESRPETLLRLLIRDAGLPEPLVAPEVPVRGGLVLHPDLAYPELRIAIEYEGDGHRTDVWQWRSDIERKERFQDAGWHVIRVTADHLFRAPRQLVERIRRVILAACPHSLRPP